MGRLSSRRGATLLLRVDPDLCDYPDEALSDEQRRSITTESAVTIFATPRINMPGFIPGELVPHLLGRPQRTLPSRSYALQDGIPVDDIPPRACFDQENPDHFYFFEVFRCIDEDGNEIHS